jgi:hypothetical protein
MVAIPVPPLLEAGHLATAADMNAISALATFLISGKPFCSAQANATQALTGGGVRNVVKMQTKLIDTDSIFTGAGGGTPFTIQTPGWYRAKYFCPLASSNGDCGMLITTGSGNPQGAGVTNECWASGTSVSSGADYTAYSGGGLLPFYMYATDLVSLRVSPNSSVSTVLTDSAASMYVEFVSA